MPTVNIPNLGKVNFPDSMSEEDISNTIRTKLLPQQSPVLIKNQSGQDSPFAGLGQGMKYWEAAPPLTMLDKVIGTGNADQLRALGDKLFTPNPNDMIFRTDEQQAPTTVLGGIGRGLENVVNSIATPGGIASAAIAGPLMSLGRIPALLTGGAGLLATAPALGQSAGILSPGSGATTPQRAEAAVLPAAMALPVAHGLIKDAITPTPQMHGPRFPRPGEPDYLTFANAVSKGMLRDQQQPLIQQPLILNQNLPSSRPTSEQIPSPTAPLPYSPAGQNTIATASKPTATGSPFNPFREVPQNAAAKQFQAEAKVNLSKMKTEELQAAYEQAQADAQKHGVAGNIQEALETAARGQFYHDELMRRETNHSLKAATGAIDFARKNKTMSPDEVNAAMQHGDEISTLAETDPPKAVKAAQNLYESIRQRNAEPINETIQQNGQEKTQGKEQNAAQTNVRQEVPKQQSTGTGRGKQPDVKSAGVLDEEKLGQRPSKPLDKSFGERGFLIAPREMWDSLFNNKTTKVDPQQLLGRLRNKLGETSATFQALTSAGLSQFLSQPRSVDEVQKWAEENTPKVEVRKFGGGFQNQHDRQIALYQHQLDNIVGPDLSGRIINAGEGEIDGVLKYVPENLRERATELWSLANREMRRGASPQNRTDAHWQSIAPKSERDMPGYVEIAVVKPGNKLTYEEHIKKYGLNDTLDQRRKFNADRKYLEGESHVQFSSSHNYPPNTLAVVRAYMETLPEKDTIKVYRGVPKGSSDELKATSHAGNQFSTDRETAQHYADQHDSGEVREYNIPREYLKEDSIHKGDYRLTKDYAPKKVFHVIEVQSDWAQRVRRLNESATSSDFNLDEQANFRKESSQISDPLLQHYERLAIKAAIDHARSEGADAIAISDAETAMMTEGHDRQAREYQVDEGEPGSQELKIPQENGMRLHYDQTLPKIAGELTGEKGERVSFGEHRMSYEYPYLVTGDPNIYHTPRKDLIFRNSSGQPKTDVSARMFNIAKAKKEFSLYGRSGAIFPKPSRGSLPPQTLQQIAQAQQKGGLKGVLNTLGKSTVANMLKGNALPKTTSVNEEVSARLYNFAQANAVSDVLSKTDPNIVLGDKWNDANFDKKLGATLVEYNLRNEGQTSIGKTWSPFKSDADYQTTLKDPEIQAAIDRHNDIVLKDAEKRHIELGGNLKRLPDQRMFVNLMFKPKEETFGARSGLKASLQRGSRFTRERKGTAEEYEISYTKLAQRMIKANYSEYLRKQLNEEYVKQGLGQWVKPGDVIPKEHVEIPTRMQRAVLLKEGEEPTIVNQDKSLYIRKDLAPEYFQAMQLTPSLANHVLRTVSDIMTKVQVQLGVDAVQHSLNIASSIDGTVRAAIGKSVVGVREADTISRIVKNVYSVFQNDLATQNLIRDMAKNYGIAREESSYEGVFGGKSIGGTAIRTIDQAGRMALFTMAKELAKEGLIKDDPIEIRNFVNKHLGQYNVRLMSAFNQFVKSTLSPFIVAGKTFNRLAASRFLMSPQVKAANPQAWVTLRARQALYTVTALVIVPAVINYAINKDAFPQGTQIGQIKLSNGKIIDAGRYTLFTRGERITGMQPVVQEQIMPRLRGEQPAALGQTMGDSLRDVVRGAAAPYAGPLPNAVATLMTGKTALGYQAAQPGEQYPYFKAASRQMNPLLGAGMTDQPKTGLEKRFAQMVGVKDSSPRGIVNNLRRQYLYKIGKINQDDFTPSMYLPLRDALLKGDVDTAKQEYQTLLQYEIQQHQGDANPEQGAKETLQKYFDSFAKSHGQTNKGQEDTFEKTLTPHQRDLYNQAFALQKTASDLFFAQIQPHSTGREPRGIRAPTIRRARGFSR